VFEIFFCIILNDYNMLAAKYVDLDGKMTMEEKVTLIKSQLRAVRWGPLTKFNKIQ
jgi:hypothetical protein